MLSRIFKPIRGLFGGTARGTSASDLSSSLVTPSWINPYRDRQRRLRKHITLTTKVLEIGPLARPIAPRSKGYNSYTVDNMDRNGLLRQYSGHRGFNPECVEEVDFVWSSGDLAEAVSEEHHGTFEVIVLSHVLEHLPDPIGFLNSAAKLLKAGGYVTLALPDKRYCFDLFRPLTTTGQWLSALRQKNAFHDHVALFDYSSMAVAKRGRIAWVDDRHKARDLTFVKMTIESAYAQFFGDEARNANNYEDCHASVFTPASFALLAQECHAIGVSPLVLEYVSSTPRYEFFAHLRLVERKPVNHHDRMQLLALMAKEQSHGFRRIKVARGSFMWTALKGLKDRISDLVLS